MLCKASVVCILDGIYFYFGNNLNSNLNFIAFLGIAFSFFFLSFSFFFLLFDSPAPFQGRCEQHLSGSSSQGSASTVRVVHYPPSPRLDSMDSSLLLLHSRDVSIPIALQSFLKNFALLPWLFAWFYKQTNIGRPAEQNALYPPSSSII